MNRKKTICKVLIFSLMISSFSISALADESFSADNNFQTNILVENGYTQETAMALSKEEKNEIVEALLDNPNAVKISSIIEEVDNLDEVETFLSYSECELEKAGMSMEEVTTTKEEIITLYNKSDTELMKENDINSVEVKMFRKAVENGEAIQEGELEKDTKKYDDVVEASGSISTAKLTYTQSVVVGSRTKAPNHKVTLSYAWKTPYFLAVFNDAIVAAWGGNLNTKSISSTANYYRWNGNHVYTTFYKSRAMGITETPQVNITFKFPQSVNAPGLEYSPKTKSGSASFTLYQTKRQGYDTKIVSRYGHRIIGIGTSIKVSKAGPTIDFGLAWDKTAQKQTTINY